MTGKFEKKEYKAKTKAQILGPSWYSRKEVQKAMFEFCKYRETIANFNNDYFAKRPDCFDYPTDIVNSARNGATSFHSSEESWEDPLKIHTDMTPEQYNEVRIGWDLLIDIDSKYLDYSKIAVRLLLEQFESHGIKNYGIKFSGNKGFHIIVPFDAFPVEVGNDLTKDMFPEWPRYIAGYLFSKIREPMNNEILGMTDRDKLEDSGELTTATVCPKCKNPIDKKIFWKYKCPDIRCKTEIESPIKKKVAMICPGCNAKMVMVGERKTDFCKSCKISTVGEEIKKSDMKFKEERTIKSTEDSIDVILMASRHLFRAPYSLHEKTAFVSMVLEKDEVDNFKPTDADVLRVGDIKSFMPKCEPDEAAGLLIQALDWGRRNKPKQAPLTKKYEGKGVSLEGLTFEESMFPPIIKKLSKGIQDDGRKRALYILLGFYFSLGFPKDYVREKIDIWNKKNKQPLKEGYLRAQIGWFEKKKPMPPNYDKPIYKEFGINSPPEPGMKNPINYAIKKAMKAKGRGRTWKPQEDSGNRPKVGHKNKRFI